MCERERACIRGLIYIKSPQKHDLFEKTLTEAYKIHISSRIFLWLCICILYIQFPIILVNGRQATWVIENPQSRAGISPSPIQLGAQVLHK